MKSQKIILNNLRRALVIEEKQGFTNTGVLGGFHAFLLNIVPRLKELFPEEDFSLFKEVANHYPHWSPLRRRDSFPQLMKWIETMEEELERTEQTDLVLKQKQHDEQPQNQEQALKHSLVWNSGNTNKISDFTNVKKSESAKGAVERKREESTGEKSENSKRPFKSLSLQYLKGVGPERAKLLARLGLNTVEDLLLYYPRRYEGRMHKKISELQHGELVTVVGRVIGGSVSPGRTKVVKLILEHEGRTVVAVWFNQTYILKQYPKGTFLAVTGKVRFKQRIPEIQVTDVEKLNERCLAVNSAGEKPVEIIPVYPETAQLSSKIIRSLVQRVLPQIPQYFPEIFPPDDMEGLMDRTAAYEQIHFPASYQVLEKARERLVFEEILFLQLAVARLRMGEVVKKSPVLDQGNELVMRFFKNLPFILTKAQQRVIQEIFNDLAQSRPMARLVQGDVGSGKTVVAMAALLQTVGSGYQGAMMAPTEILALQHYQSLEKAFTPLGVKTVFLHGNLSKAERNNILSMIRNGEAHVVVGTHALIQDEVEFRALGLAITDEQHRFGVRQRSLLQEKGESPHVLVMTATPIPRTLALTLYGDLQLSVLDEMPAGRKGVITKHLTERARPSLEKFMAEQLALGRQIYVVCPLVEESEAIDTISATERVAQLTERFPNYRVVLLHGKMKSSEKEEIMNSFQKGEIHILVSTTVVEVGVNVPNASVMVIEGAERFGLAQLHQLRGRVGRGSEQSYCILMSDSQNSKRLSILCQTNDGFKIAEEDLRLRGPGELFGTRQHGLAELKLTDLSKDGKLVEKAYQYMQKIMKNPEKYKKVIEEVERFFPPEKIGLN